MEDLKREVTQEEVKQIVYMMNDDKSPGPDGFLVGFFKHNWDIMGVDMSEAILEFFKKGSLLKEWNTTFIIFIPNTKR